MAQRISKLRDQLDSPAELDRPLELGGQAKIVPTDSAGIAFSRTPGQVLNIVYGQRGAASAAAAFTRRDSTAASSRAETARTPRIFLGALPGARLPAL